GQSPLRDYVRIDIGTRRPRSRRANGHSRFSARTAAGAAHGTFPIESAFVMKPLLLIASVAVSSIAVFGQAAPHANERYKTEEGRSAVAQTLVAEGREKEQRPRELLTEIGVSTGMVIADVGTGAGFMLPYMSEMVGQKGKIYAEDIFPDFLAKAK